MIPRWILKILMKSINKPSTRNLAKSIIKDFKIGNIASAERNANYLSRQVEKVGRKASNVVGRLSTKTKTLSPDVNLRKQEFFYNPHQRKAGEVLFTDFKKTPMIDIDVAKGGMHYPGNITHADRRTALQSLFKHLRTPEGQSDVFRTYKTKGGLRLFDVGRRRTPSEFYNTTFTSKGNLAKRLGGDKDYELYNRSRGMFGSRISPKPGRIDDTIKYIDTFGGGQHIPINVQEVKLFHDDLIKKIIKSSRKEEINIGGLFDLIGTI